MDAPRAVLLVVLLVFLIITPETQHTNLHQQREVKHVLDDERRAIDTLNATRNGGFDPLQNHGVNLTGLSLDDGYAWYLLPEVQSRARQQAEAINGMWRNLRGDDSGSSNASVLSNDVTIPFYHNVTGILHGTWVRSKVGNAHEPTALNLTAINPRNQYTTTEYDRNITGREGYIQLKLDEKKSESLAMEQHSVREVRAKLTIQDETSSGDGWDLTLHGVHFPESGGILLSTSSDKFAGIFALPHFALSESEYVLTQQLLNRTLMASVLRQEEASRYMTPPFPWSSVPDNPAEMMFPTPHCEYLLYLQQHIPKFLGRTLPGNHDRLLDLQTLEQELRFPTGASLGSVPLMEMSAVIFSPDCGFVLESKGPPDYAQQAGNHLRGPKIEAYLLSAKRVILLFSFVVAAQVFLLMRQMKETSTPSTRSRISFYSIAIMAMGDGFVFIGFWTVSMVIDATFLIMISTAFLAFLCVAFFAMKFLTDIWSVQAPERQEAERRRAAMNPSPLPPPPAMETRTTPTVVITPAGADALPLPVTAPRPAELPLIILPPDQDLEAAEAEDAAATTEPATTQTTLGSARRENRSLYSRFYFLMMGTLLLSLHATNWPTTLRIMYMDLLSGAYLSLWVPQIYRNIIRNCRKALRWEFVIGQSVLRLTPIIYFYTVADNVLFIENHHYTAYVFVSWVWVQVLVLASQEILGPRFFIPHGWAPPAYDYHPILREEDEEAGATMPIGFTQATTVVGSPRGSSDAKDSGQRTFDCAICMQNIDVPVVSAGGGEGAAGSSLATTLFSRRAYMVTPCRHIFHSPCLEGWMRYRLQCPICRENLPPL